MTERTQERRRVSLPGIVLALVFMAVSSIGVTGDPFWLLNEGTRWAAAVVLALIGIGLVASSLTGVRKRQG